MGVREIERSMERWQLEVNDVLRRMYLAPTPRDRERWHALWFLARGWTAAGTGEALGRHPYTIGRWLPAFGNGGAEALIFEQSGGSPPPSARGSRRR